jgi:hypothetical protein
MNKTNMVNFLIILVENIDSMKKVFVSFISFFLFSSDINAQDTIWSIDRSNYKKVVGYHLAFICKSGDEGGDNGIVAYYQDGKIWSGDNSGAKKVVAYYQDGKIWSGDNSGKKELIGAYNGDFSGGVCGAYIILNKFNPEQKSEYNNLNSFVGFLNQDVSKRNSSTSSSNVSPSKKNICYSCKGTGKCSNCNRIFKKPYYIGTGKYEFRNEIKLGFTLCGNCQGYGHKQKSRSQGGWEPAGDCSSYECVEGWIKCKKCDSRNLGSGNCHVCKGTGILN